MVNLFFILALNCRPREEHCPNKCPFDLHFECHNFLTIISTRVVKGVFEKSFNFSFFCFFFLSFFLYFFCISLHTAYCLYHCIPFWGNTVPVLLARIKYPVIK